MTDTTPRLQSKQQTDNNEMFAQLAQDQRGHSQPFAASQTPGTGKASKNQNYQMDYDQIMRKGVQPSNVQIYEASKNRKPSALQSSQSQMKIATKPVDERSYMATTKSKFFRQAAIQDDMNFELSRKFIGKSNTTYKKLKDLTDFTDELPPSPGKRSQMSGGAFTARDRSKPANTERNASAQKESEQKKLRMSKSMHQDQLAKMQMKLNDQQKLYLQLQDISDEQLRRNFEQRMSSSRKQKPGSRSQERDSSEILNQKNKSLLKIGVNLKADRARVDEKNEGSEDSDINRNFENSIRKEKIHELTRRLHEEGERKTRARIEMAENKEKLDMSNCTFKPTVNKLTSKQRDYRQNRFVGNQLDQPQKTFEIQQKRAQTADAKKVAADQKPVTKAKLPAAVARGSTSKSAEKVGPKREVTGIAVKPLDLGRGTLAVNDFEQNAPFEMSDDGVAKYQSNIQLKTQPLTTDRRNTGTLSERNIGKESRITNSDANEFKVHDNQSDVFNYLSMKGSMIEKKKAIEIQKQKRDLELCTFVPKINKPRAKTMRRDPSMEKKQAHQDDKVDTFDKLSKQQRVYEKYKKDREVKELQYCTFKPQIDQKSRKLVAKEYSKYSKQAHINFEGNPSTGNQIAQVVETRPAMQRHDELYGHYKQKQAKIKELQEIKAQNDMLPYTFKPNLTKTQKKNPNANRKMDMTTESKDYPIDQHSKAISHFKDEDTKAESLRRNQYYQDMDDQIKQRFAPKHQKVVEEALKSSRRTKATRVNPVGESPEIVFKDEPTKQKGPKANIDKSRPSVATSGNDKKQTKDEILESAYRIIQQHNSDKKANSPEKNKKEEKNGVFIPQGLSKSKQFKGSPRNQNAQSSKKLIQNSVQNLSNRLDDIQHVRTEPGEKIKTIKTPSNQANKNSFAAFDSSKQNEPAQKTDGTIYKNLQKVKDIGTPAVDSQPPSTHRNSFSKQSKIGSIGRTKLGKK